MNNTPYTNKAAWLEAKGSKLHVDTADLVLPGPGEILVENRAWAMNPIDWKMQDWGLHVETYPAIIGCAIAGNVVAVGDEVAHLQVRDAEM